MFTGQMVVWPALIMALAGFARNTALPRSSPGQAESTRAELVRIENEIVQANNRCDYGYFRRIEAPEFIFTDGNGGASGRAEDLAGESSCHPSASQQVIDEVRVLDYGSVAVLNARNTTTLVRNGLTVTRHSRFTDVFVRRHGAWQLVSGQSTRIPEPAPARP
ncbi:MAG TPA: nuclear transport factor 2 family protein [Gemmatimonadales bacterium]|jgi:hypothetical protein